MIDWKKCTDAMPDDQQECFIYDEEADKAIGPIIYRTDMTGWLDLFATAEAGHCYMPGPKGPVSHWAIWNGPRDDH